MAEVADYEQHVGREARGRAAARESKSTLVARRSAAAFLIALLLAVSLVGVGCGGSSSSSSSSSDASTSVGTSGGKERFANTKFLLHAGLAFGVFHRYIYKPFKTGSFKDPAHHKLALVTAGAAALFAYHEVTLAKQAAPGSAVSRKLFAPLAALGATLSGLAALKGGHSKPSQIESANSAIAGIKQDGSSSGVNITDRAPASSP